MSPRPFPSLRGLCSTMFYRHYAKGKPFLQEMVLLLLVWVDDIWAAFTHGTRNVTFDPFFKVYTRTFPVKDLGSIKRFVGIDVDHNRVKGTLSMSMETYLSQMVPKFLSAKELEDLEGLPAEQLDKHGRQSTFSNISLAESDADRTDRPYLSALASVLFAVSMVHGQCAFHVSFLSRFCNSPSHAAWDALARVMRYLYRTRKFALTYRSGSIRMPHYDTCTPPLNYGIFMKLHGMLIISDAAWKTGGTYLGWFMMFAGAAIDWSSVLAKVKLSSTEAEIAAGSVAGKRSAFARGMIGEVISLPKLPISHVIDNSATPALTENLGVSKKTEHFRRWLHYMRYLVTHGFTYVHLVRTHEMQANALTKVDNKGAFLSFRGVFFGMEDAE